MNTEKMALLIETYRKQHKLSVAQLAEKAGLAVSHMDSLRKGTTSNPGVVTLAKLAQAVGQPLDLFLIDCGILNATTKPSGKRPEGEVSRVGIMGGPIVTNLSNDSE